MCWGNLASLCLSATPWACNRAPVRSLNALNRHQKLSELSMKTHALIWATVAIAIGILSDARAEQPPPPCHPNPNAAADRLTVANRGDIANLPDPLKDRLVQLADRPHSYLPLQIFAEADKASQLFQYYLLDADGFEPNVFTKIFPGVNDAVQLTPTGG